MKIEEYWLNDLLEYFDIKNTYIISDNIRSSVEYYVYFESDGPDTLLIGLESNNSLQSSANLRYIEKICSKNLDKAVRENTADFNKIEPFELNNKRSLIERNLIAVRLTRPPSL